MRALIFRMIFEGDIVDPAAYQAQRHGVTPGLRKIVTFEEGRCNINPKLKVKIVGNIKETPEVMSLR